jgi:hypothetical protein
VELQRGKAGSLFVIDLLTNQTVTRTADFTVTPPPTVKPITCCPHSLLCQPTINGIIQV